MNEFNDFKVYLFSLSICFVLEDMLAHLTLTKAALNIASLFSASFTSFMKEIFVLFHNSCLKSSGLIA